MNGLVPAEVSGYARPNGRLAFGFGPRFFIALVIGLIGLIPAWWSRDLIALMLLWDAFVLAVWFVDLRRLPKPAAIEVRRRWEEALSFTHAISVHIEIKTSALIPLRVSITDETPHALRDEPARLELILPGGSDVQANYPVRPRMRGDAPLGRLFLRYRSYLGFAERWAVADLEQTVRILPDLAPARDQSLFLIRSRQVDLEKRRRRQKGLGREFDSLREYRQGDELRDVCWTATARRHQLITRTYQVERSQTVWIVVDAGRLLRARVEDAERGLPVTKLDFAAEAALALAQVASQSGDKAGLLAYGRQIQQSVAPGRGSHHIRRMVDCLAQVRSEGPEADHGRAARTLLRAQTRRSLVVWITDFAETATVPEVIEHAMHMTRRHLVVFAALTQPDLIALTRSVPETEENMFRYTAALEITQRRERLLAGLRQRGVMAMDLPPGSLTSSLINQYLEVKDRGLL